MIINILYTTSVSCLADTCNIINQLSHFVVYMDTIYSELLSQIKNIRCDTHNKQPSIEFVDGKLTVVSCCDDIKIVCYKHILKVLQSFKDQRTSGIVEVVK